jgi:predicted protein tyrosine phosphatase
MTHALFICGKARMRSPTAAEIAGAWDDVTTDFAGLSNDADEKVSVEQLDWADIIFVMEARQARRLKRLFPAHLRGKRVVTLNIPDRFTFMDPALVTVLEQKLLAILGAKTG